MTVPHSKRPSSLRVLCIALATGLSGCAWAPGMHLGMSAPEGAAVDTSAQVQGMNVRLRSLTPAVANELSRGDRSVRSIPESYSKVVAQPYRLGLYDVVTVAVWEHPELSMPLGMYRADLAAGQMVDESGNIFYPYVGMIPAKGLTSHELRDRLLAALSKVLNNPQLDVKITGFRSQKIFVHGGVLRPGAIPMSDVPLTLLDAVSQAGGLSPLGDGTMVELRRDGNKVLVDLYADYGKGVDPSRLVLKDGDVVRVPTQDEGVVYVLGEVPRPMAMPLVKGRLSLAQAITEAGGISPLSAAGKGLYVARLRDSATVELYHLDARNPLALALGDRFPLKPRDIVWVDATGLSRWNRVVSLLAPTATLYNSLMQSANYTKALVP